MKSLSMATLVPLGRCNQQKEDSRGENYTELVRLRGATLTMLQTQRISVDEACRVRAMLDAAREAVDLGRMSAARTKLAAVRTYLKARQGEAL